jgi:hypothetical protein
LDLARTANQPVAITMKKFMRQFPNTHAPILKRLTGGARRSIGRSNQVVAQVLAHPNLFPHLFDGLASGDEVLRMRAADALEKITTRRPKLLQPFKKKFLAIASSAIQQEVRWTPPSSSRASTSPQRKAPRPSTFSSTTSATKAAS